MTEEFGLEEEYKNAQGRLSEQIETLRTFSREGQRMVRISILSGSVIVAGFGFFGFDNVVPLRDVLLSGCGVQLLGDCVLSSQAVAGIALGLFFLSTFMHTHAMGYEARGIHNLSNPKDMQLELTDPSPKGTYLMAKVEVLRDRIAHNDRIIYALENYLAMGKLFLVSSLVFTGALVLAKLLGAPLSEITIIILGVLYFVLTRNQSRILPSIYQEVDGPKSIYRYKTLYPRDYNGSSESSSE